MNIEITPNMNPKEKADSAIKLFYALVQIGVWDMEDVIGEIGRLTALGVLSISALQDATMDEIENIPKSDLTDILKKHLNRK